MSDNGVSKSNGKDRNSPSLDVQAQLAGKGLVVIGGTGFLGKLWWAHLLFHYPDVGRIYLVMRTKGGKTVEERFWQDVATSPVFDPLRAQHGAAFDDYLREKVVPIEGDVVQPLCGIAVKHREELRGRVHAVVNAAGVVDFDPPLDEGLEVNAFGVQNLVTLARDLGDLPLMHTSTCYVAGDRTGFVEERDPKEHPFPRADELERSHWDPDREIAECLDVIEQARHRAGDAFRQSRFLDEAKKNLRERGEPVRGAVLDSEVARVKRKFVEAQLADMGMERAKFWGFPNTYTYTKAIGEQIAAASGLAFTIVRPAVIESTVAFPFPGWNEGINTSAPLIYIIFKGGLQMVGADNPLDFIPCDMVVVGMTLALAELLEGTAPPVYQLGSSDTNPCSMRRLFELTGLYKRRHYRRTGKGGPVLSYLQSHWEGALLSSEQFDRYGPLFLAEQAKTASGLLKQAAVGPAKPLLKPAAKALEGFSKQQQRVGKILSVFVPFTAEYNYVFRCDHVRIAHARLGEADKQRLDWAPESLDWRSYFLDIHAPGLEKWVFPLIEERIRRPKPAPRRYETLPEMLDEMAGHFDLAVALQRTEAEGLSRISFRDWRACAAACAKRLVEAGVRPGDRVMIAATNHPAWPISFFGILWAGATVVPLEATVEPAVAENLARASGAKVALLDAAAQTRVGSSLAPLLTCLDVQEAAEAGPQLEQHPASSEDVAVLIYTSGTTGAPKGVMLSHENLAALVASLAPLFPLSRGDRILSVLPLHHTFELTCGMLLPLTRGARIIYLDELNAERLEHALKAGRITGLVGVPALWEMLERRITARVAERGRLASHVFDFAVELNRTLGKNLGVDGGRLLFGQVHEAFGGHLKFLVSGGAALPESTHKLFSGLGMHLAEGYGLTEASPVLTVAQAGPKATAGHVGKAIPGVEIRIADPDGKGVGEVLARGPNVMLGYTDPEATKQTIDADGWLHTGDLGQLDRKGNLVISGRAKDVIVAANGENVYPDDVEARLGRIDHIKEIAIVGVPAPRGGERIGCVAVAEPDEELNKAERIARARRTLEAELGKLPVYMRPAQVTVTEAPLPRTSTRKVKRPEVRRMLEYSSESAAKAPADAHGGVEQVVRSAVALIARKDPKSLEPTLSLRGDLGFDSLMLLELLVALESKLQNSCDGERLAACVTIGDVQVLARETRGGERLSRTSSIEDADQRKLEVPPALREAAMQWMGRAQMSFYDSVLRTKVSGRAFIPHNQNCIVAANHSSHLDMGLVKYALGSYGRELVSLAAQDYFFEDNTWRKTYFENFTNLVPITRSGSLRQALRQAGELLEQGKNVLIFPEGTRSPDGQVHEFKAAVGHLSLAWETDILPVWLGGTHNALPKGATVLRRRDVKARIGLPLRVQDLKRLTAGMSPTDASRTVAQLARKAVSELSQGRVLDISTMQPEAISVAPPEPESLEPVFRELKSRFVAGSVDSPVSFYFSLGESERWSVRITRETCEVAPGKVLNPADCVLKTSPDMFTRIVRESYVPSPAEFMSGSIKSNNIALLVTFQKAFQLQGQSN